jgi:hypothetical protein
MNLVGDHRRRRTSSYVEESGIEPLTLGSQTVSSLQRGLSSRRRIGRFGLIFMPTAP